MSKGDIAAMSYFINLIADFFPEFSYRWCVFPCVRVDQRYPWAGAVMYSHQRAGSPL
jgi:hypothetical protein